MKCSFGSIWCLLLRFAALFARFKASHTRVCVGVCLPVCVRIYNHSCILCLIDCQIELSIELALQKLVCLQLAAPERAVGVGWGGTGQGKSG